MKNFVLCVFGILLACAAFAEVPSGIPQKAVSGLTKARQWHPDAVLVMIEVNDYSKTGNFLLKFSFYSPSDGTGLWITSGGGMPDHTMQAGRVNWPTKPLPANFMDLPAAVAEAQKSGMGSVIDHAMLWFNNSRIQWEITPAFNDPHFHVYAVAALPNPEEDRKQEIEALLDKAQEEVPAEKFDEAIADLTKVIQLDSKNVDAYQNRGEAYYHKGSFDNAFNDFSKAIEIDPKSWEAYWRIGNIFAKKENFSKAIEAYNKAIESGCTGYLNGICVGDRGIAYMDMKSFDSAVNDFTKALESTNASRDFNAPERTKYFQYRAYCYAQKGMIDQAISDYKEALQADPKNTTASKNLQILEKMKNEQ